MVLLEAVFVVALLGLITYVTIRSLTPSSQGRFASRAGSWRAAHYDANGVTRVVVEKVSPGGASVLDEHLVSTIPVDDPEYDAKFLAAMSTARERQALFEAEEG
jgi:hypothetical protein